MKTDAAPLPGVLDEIAELVGRAVALDLAIALGGAEIRVPKPVSISPIHGLAVAVGADNARAIAERFQGETVYVPMARRALVRHLTRQGATVNEIAATLGIARQTVRRYRRGK